MTTNLKNCLLQQEQSGLVFPGVGVRLTGKEHAVFQAFEDQFKPLFVKASDYRDVDFIRHLENGTIDTLADGTRQFFTYAFSGGAADVAIEHYGVSPQAAGGYSFGIYGALYAARAFTFEDGLRVLDRAYRIVSSVADADQLGMGIVVGLEEEELRSIVEGRGLDSVCLTNTNHDLCHVFSGRRLEITSFLDMARQEGAFKSEPLEVDVPYHHPKLLKDAPSELRPYLEPIAWSKPRFPIISSIDSRFLETPDSIIDFVSKHLATPINWRNVVKKLYETGAKTLFECGPGISLSQNGRFLPFDMTYLNVKKALKCQVKP